MPRSRKPARPSRYFNSSPEVIRYGTSIDPALAAERHDGEESLCILLCYRS